MSFASVIPEFVLWLSVAGAGLGISTIYASTILWISEYLAVTGTVGGIFLIGASCGLISGPPLAGMLFQQKSHMWMVYLSLMAAAIHIILILGLNLFVKCQMPLAETYCPTQETGEEIENVSLAAKSK